MNQPFFPRYTRRAFAKLLVHVTTFIVAYLIAFELRFEFSLPDDQWVLFLLTLPAVLIVKSLLFYASGQCHQSWEYVGFSDLTALVRTGTLASLVIATANHFMQTSAKSFGVPRGVLVVDWMATLIALGCARAAWRIGREEFKPLMDRAAARKTLIIGASPAGATLGRQLLHNPRLNYQVVGYLDPDVTRHGSMIGGVPVLGDWVHATHFAAKLGAKDVFVMADVLTGVQLRALMDACRQAELQIKVVPAIDQLLSGNFALQMRDVEINDLLRREPVQLNDDAIRELIAGRVILVTGAGGSIGSEICRQVLRYQPRALLLVERTENALFFIDQELTRTHPDARIIPCLADITDEERMRQILEAHQPKVVFHAAAHKHVPMMEHNPGEAIRNNVLGTRLLAELSQESGVDEFVMISTDKAVNPTSVMGVSKHLAERYIHALSEQAATKFVAVRFGNVLASSGSVVPIFQEQIRRGGPVTVTHPEMQRFFMTIPEASQLVLQAAAMGKGGEIFVLDMGESVRIVDLAHDLIRLSGLEPDDIEIVFTGLRPGEKLYEELYFQEEEMLPTPHKKVFAAYHRSFTLKDVQRSIDDLAEIVHAAPDTLRQRLKELVPEYTTPDEAAAAAIAPQLAPAANALSMPLRVAAGASKE